MTDIDDRLNALEDRMAALDEAPAPWSEAREIIAERFRNTAFGGGNLEHLLLLLADAMVAEIRASEARTTRKIIAAASAAMGGTDAHDHD